MGTFKTYVADMTERNSGRWRSSIEDHGRNHLRIDVGHVLSLKLVSGPCRTHKGKCICKCSQVEAKNNNVEVSRNVPCPGRHSQLD